MEEEIEALYAIYCEEDEFKILQKGSSLNGNDTIVSITQEHVYQNRNINIKATFCLHSLYPDKTVPDISIQCLDISRDKNQSVKADMQAYAAQLEGQPMIMDLMFWLKQEFPNYTANWDKTVCSETTSASCTLEKDEMDIALLRLDHMRAKTKYTKTIQKWTSELGLKGRLIFQDRVILILLQGVRSSLKEYVSRQKTVNVDVDSRGRSCKERLLSILSQERLANHHRFDEFEVVEFPSARALEDWFTSYELQHFYKSYVLPLYKFDSKMK